jgi:hydroxylamine reductase
MNMFCYQCEQTAKGTGCTAHGVCGKDPDVADLQDLLIYAIKDIARYASRARKLGAKDNELDRFVCNALFATITNVDFDAERLQQLLKQAGGLRQRAVGMYERACADANETPEKLEDPIAWWQHTDDLSELIREGETVTPEQRIEALGPDIAGLQELLIYGLKGSAAYLEHAWRLGVEDDKVYGFVHDALDYLTQRPVDANEILGWVLKEGEVNLRVMEMLDQANTGAYGNPEPTKVRTTPVAGKCIAVSGHDLRDLHDILEQTAGKGINVYTHSEMLACNGYPELKKYPHFVGNYGGAWQDQRQDFDAFPGAILMTTNCIQQPKGSYMDRIFTSGATAWPGVKHIADRDFTPVIEAALAAPGFSADAEEAYTTTGFAHNAVLSIADQVIDAVKEGKIRRFFLVGGCDGAKPGRNYYTDLAKAIPQDCVILTLACGKYRFNKLQFGTVPGTGIPRLLDCGQCNDAFSAIQIAVALAGAFKCGVNELPLSFVLSWFEQKAVAILLTLLHLGVKNIRIGPSLPAFVSPAVLDVLVKEFNLMPIGEAHKDLEAMLGAPA